MNILPMTIETLVNIAPPPKQPRDGGRGKDWSEVERSIHTQLPTDYKQFVDLYGTGELAGCIWVYNPFRDISSGQNLGARMEEVLSIWRLKRAQPGAEDHPYRFYPEPGGLLPWGHVDSGAELFWRTSGDPDQWDVVVSTARDPEFEQFDKSMSGFLVSLFSGEIRSDLLPEGLQKRKRQVTFLPVGSPRSSNRSP